MKVAKLFALIFVAACGGKAKSAETIPSGSDPTPIDQAEVGNAADMESPETLEAIRTALDRKRSIAARCLSEAIDANELKKHDQGKITFSFVLLPAGKATDIKVIQSSLKSAKLTECVTAVIEKITFPTLKQQRDWSYTYAFEAM